MKLSGWGNYPRLDVALHRFRGEDVLAGLIAGKPSMIARGNGRSYGDAALNPKATLSTLRHDRLLAFDPDTGRLRCEAGVMLSDLVDIFLPRGWFVPVTPGTRLVTIGGMIAADVHGKNHHLHGTFGRHVESLRLMTGGGRVVNCSLSENPALFRATIGGMGLTGVITEATFRLMAVETAFIRQETLAAPDLDAVMAAFEESAGWTYSVAWIDCLARGRHSGRALLYRGEHARRDELPPARQARSLAAPVHPRRRVPFALPDFTLNRLSVSAFNALYYHKGAAKRHAVIDALTFFYPLDAILDWNRIYGPSGFTQYQCVLPKPASRAGIGLLLERIAAAGSGSFLAVLKLFGRGDADGGIMSFPMEGYTLALDFAASSRNFSLLTELDAIVRDHGGRIYLAKDARMGVDLLRRGYAEGLDAFLAERAAAQRFQSVLSQRLGL
ncbi:MAG: FAD-binding oxidoreductase [Alphaproteobacteria bacterium]|nr:FAD-binding oxidoreductase [Alphaproteobacteria bacterium]